MGHCRSAGPGSSILVVLPQPCGRCLPLSERYVPLRGGPVSGALSGPPVSLSHGLRAMAVISSSWEYGAAGRCACITVVWLSPVTADLVLCREGAQCDANGRGVGSAQPASVWASGTVGRGWWPPLDGTGVGQCSEVIRNVEVVGRCCA